VGARHGCTGLIIWGRIGCERGRDPEHALLLVVLDVEVEVLEELRHVASRCGYWFWNERRGTRVQQT
jgi:hypothetical protein